MSFPVLRARDFVHLSLLLFVGVALFAMLWFN